MKDVPSFDMIPSDEAEKVAEIVKNTGASKFCRAFTIFYKTL